MGKCLQILQKMDIFTYIPVPHTYPVSSNKSKAASLIFVLGLLIFFIYDFTIFIIFNTPVINTYTQSTTKNQIYTMPSVAFGFLYGEDLDQVLNDQTYFTYSFVTVDTQYSNGSIANKKIEVQLKELCAPSWLQSYNQFYSNLTCIQTDLQLMNPPLKRPESIFQRLVISLCDSSANTNCRNKTQIAEMVAGGRLFFFINQPQGFNYQTGQIILSEFPFEIYTFFLIPQIYNRINIQFERSIFRSYPNYLTSFTTSEKSYMKSLSPFSSNSNVTIYNQNLLMSVSLSLTSKMVYYQIHFETILQHLSLWGALTSVAFTLLAICCLTYNKKKFLRKNPDWGIFDETLKKKFQVQLTEKRQDDETGISQIRKQVQQDAHQHQL